MASVRRHHPDVFQPNLNGFELPASPSEIVAILGDVVTPERLARVRTVASMRTRRVVPVLESLADPHNGAAILRSADAFGIAEVHIVPGEHGFHAARTITKGTHRWLDLVSHRGSEECAEKLVSAGYAIYVASMEGDVGPAALSNLDKVAIVFGNEHRGPSPAMRERAAGTYAIPMRGFVESLNVSVAAAITLHGVVGNRPSELDEADQETLVARMLWRTVSDAQDIVEERLGIGPS